METVTVKNIKIFDKNNPNFTITNTNEEIINLFSNKNVPVFLDDLPLKIHDNTQKVERVIGVIKEATRFVGSELLGEVFFWKEEDSHKTFFNYEVILDSEDNSKISLVMGVQFNW